MVEGSNGEEIIWQDGNYDTPTIKLEDARLIAAAPELLEVLQLCEGNIASLLASAHPKVYGEWLHVVRAAIAKATGEKA